MRGHRHRIALLAVLALFVATLVGCGGGSDNSSPPSTTQTASVKFDVAWADRSRAVAAPSSALSAKLILRSAKTDGTDFVYTFNRAAAPAGYTQNVTTGTQVAKVGTWAMTLNFYAQADGGGAVVGTAGANVTLATDGSGIGSVATTGTIASVAVAANQTLNVGQTADVTFSVKDASGAILAVSPGSAFVAIAAGGDKLKLVNQQAQGVGNGTATVTATVDGKTSAAQTITVIGVPGGLETTNGLTGRYGTVRLRVKGIVDATQAVSVKVGSVAATTATIAYTDANAPSASAGSGGAIDFLVPTGLATGSQSLVVTLGGNVLSGVAANVSDANPFAVFTLGNGGKFAAELRRDVSPNTVDNFTGLATGSKTWTDPQTNQPSSAPLYNGTRFHRAIAGFVRQGGDPLSKFLPAGDSRLGTGGPGFTIPFETNSLTHNDGAIAMARAASRDSGGSQFYICDGPQHSLDGNYVVFGQVVEGLSVAKGITLTYDSNNNPIAGAVPTVLTSVVISGKLD